jgi:hypothetical protein
VNEFAKLKIKIGPLVLDIGAYLIRRVGFRHDFVIGRNLLKSLEAKPDWATNGFRLKGPTNKWSVLLRPSPRPPLPFIPAYPVRFEDDSESTRGDGSEEGERLVKKTSGLKKLKDLGKRLLNR